jgi:hypothetical protein
MSEMMPELAPRGLIGYIKEMTGLRGEGAMVFQTMWKELTPEDKEDLLRWAHEQGDTHVVMTTNAVRK